MEADVAIVGAGPAGMAASLAAADAGLRVALVDAYPQLGGQYFKQIPAEFYATDPAAINHDFAPALRRLRRIEASPEIRTQLSATVWNVELSETRFVLHISTDGGAMHLSAGQLILCTGAYERVLPFPGWDLPGVMSAGAAQTLLKSQRVRPGMRAVVAGSGPFLLPVAAAMVEAGIVVAAVCEAARPWRWLRHGPRLWWHTGTLLDGARYLRVLRRHGVPILYGRTVTRVEGKDRAERALISCLSADWKPLPNGAQWVDVDLVCTGFGFVPSLELARQVGCATHFDPAQQAAVVTRDDRMRSSLPGVYVAGEIAGIGGWKAASHEGTVAGMTAAQGAGRGNSSSAVRLQSAQGHALLARSFGRILSDVFAVRPGWTDWLTPETVVCRCEEVAYGEVQDAMVRHHAADARTIKSLTRCGMGPCQGRMCGFAVSQIISQMTGVPADSAGDYASRPIARPTTLGDMAADGS